MLPRQAERSTRLDSGESAIATPEHLLAALLFHASLPVDILCDAAELPGLDGSALPFREALAALDPAAASSPGWREYATDLEWEYHWSYGHIRVRPAAGFRLHWELDRLPLRQTFRLEDPVSAYREILPARTFAFHREWRQASAAGLMAGADEDSGLLLAESEAEYREVLGGFPSWPGGPYPLLNQPAWRMDDEPVKHKILDLLGDLALAGLALPKAEIEIRNGGHAVNHLLVDRLLASRSI
jgi:UDP-3-O-acyl-N-acetylglucosamine deacetylase